MADRSRTTRRARRIGTRRHDARAIEDAVNLTTLIQWGAAHHGSFTMGRRPSNLWYIKVERTGLLGKPVFAQFGRDLSTLVSQAAERIRSLPEWTQPDKTVRQRTKAEIIEYDTAGDGWVEVEGADGDQRAEEHDSAGQ